MYEASTHLPISLGEAAAPHQNASTTHTDERTDGRYEGGSKNRFRMSGKLASGKKERSDSELIDDC